MIIFKIELLFLLLALIHSHVLHVPDIDKQFSREDDGFQVSTRSKSVFKIETGQNSFILFDKLPPCESPILVYQIATSPIERICNDESEPRPVNLPNEYAFVKYSGTEEISFTICQTQICGKDETVDESNDVQSVVSSICSSPICRAYPEYCATTCSHLKITKKWILCRVGTSYRWFYTKSCSQIAITTTSRTTTTTQTTTSTTTTTTTTTTTITTTTTTTTTTMPNLPRWHLCNTGYYYGTGCPETAITTTTTTKTPATKQPPYSIIYCYGIPFRGTHCPGRRTTISTPTTKESQALGDTQSNSNFECGISLFSARHITDREHTAESSEPVVQIVVSNQTFANETRELSGALVDLQVVTSTNVNATSVINGGFSVSQKGKYPWLVSLRSSSGFHFCGGALLNENWVLSAAHCKVRRSDKCVFATLARKGTTGAVFRGVGDVKTHPQASTTIYNTWTYDFELVKLDSPVVYSDYIRPICLPTQFIADQSCMLAGWGRIKTNPVEYAESLQEAEITMKQKSSCGAYTPLIDDSSFCAEGRASACNGDSGGPLVCEDSSGRAFVTGVTSWASSSCKIGAPSGFGDVSAVRSWIDQTIST